MTPLVWTGLIAAAAGPAGVYAWGGHAWALGLWIGEALGLGIFIWIRRTVRLAFAAADPGRPVKKTLLWHSGLRTAVAAAVLIVVIQIPAIQIWGVVLGYTVVQIPALIWQVRMESRRKRGVE